MTSALSMNHRRPPGFLAAAFLILAAALAIHRIYDPDFWMHLATGNHILRTGEIPRTNLFSFTHPEHSWIDVYWAYQTVLSVLWKWGASPAVVALKLGLTLGLAAIILLGLRHRQTGPLTWAQATVLLLGWLVLTPRLTDRPELVSYVLLAATLALLRAQRWWWCVALQVIWANVQGYFYLGPLLLLLFSLSQLLERRFDAARRVGLAAVASLLACAVSPFGWRNLLLGRAFFGSLRGLHNDIDELASPFHPAVWSRNGNGLLLMVFVIVVVALFATGRKRLSQFDWLVAALSLLMAFFSQRTVPIFILCGLPPALACAGTLPAAPTFRMNYVLAAIMIALAVDFVAGTDIILRFRQGGRVFGWGVDDRWLPDRAVAVLEQKRSGAVRILNAHFHTGGYILAATDCRLPVFIDGRLEAYPLEFLQEYLRIFDDERAFRDLVVQYRITHVLVVKENPETQRLCARLSSDPAWRRMYSDGIADVFARSP